MRIELAVKDSQFVHKGITMSRRIFVLSSIACCLALPAVALPINALRVSAAGCAVSEGGKCVVPPPVALKVEEAPSGIEVLGATLSPPLNAEVTHVVAAETGQSCAASAAGSCLVPGDQVNPQGVGATDIASGSGYNSGGCANNDSCNNLQLVWHETGYWGSSSNNSWSGAASFNALEPANAPNDGYEYDFLDTLSSVSAGSYNVCSLQNTFSSDTSASSPLSWWPTNGTLVSDGGSKNMSIGGTYNGVSLGLSDTVSTSNGYMEGKIWADNQQDPNFSATWSYQNSSGQGASDCNWGTVGMEGGIAFRTPVGQSYDEYFNAEVSGYEEGATCYEGC
jgi:hypothetical protein